MKLFEVAVIHNDVRDNTSRLLIPPRPVMAPDNARASYKAIQFAVEAEKTIDTSELVVLVRPFS